MQAMHLKMRRKISLPGLAICTKIRKTTEEMGPSSGLDVPTILSCWTGAVRPPPARRSELEDVADREHDQTDHPEEERERWNVQKALGVIRMTPTTAPAATVVELPHGRLAAPPQILTGGDAVGILRFACVD